MSLSLILTTCRDKSEAKQIAEALVRENLVACAIVMAESESFCVWEGGSEWTAEVPLLLKTIPEKVDQLRIRLHQLHSYTTPAFLKWDADSSPDYESWARSSVAGVVEKLK